MITRIITVGPQRLGNLLLSLNFDYFLDPKPHNTVIITPLDRLKVQTAVANSHPQLKFEIIADDELQDIYPGISQWQDHNNFRAGWLKQQALKLAALDHFATDTALIQDPDTFCIKPYCYWHNNTVNLFVQLDQSHYDGYYQTLESVLAIPRQTPHSFVSEFMPIEQQVWTQCRHRIESIIERPWLDLVQFVPFQDFGRHRKVQWFSEYELLGNWQYWLGTVNLVPQHRFVFNDIETLQDLNTQYNTVCDRGIRGQVKGLPGVFSNLCEVNFDAINQACDLIRSQLI